MTSSLLSKLTVGAIGLTCKTFLNIGYCSSVKVNGLDILLEALRNEERNQGRGIMTSEFCSFFRDASKTRSNEVLMKFRTMSLRKDLHSRTLWQAIAFDIVG